jgi:hypothetical protein
MRIGKAILVVALGCSAASQAWADPRGDVLAGIQRCGVIHDDRVWLDCVYGANQPMRAQLGLTPAPEFQQRLVPAPGTVLPQQMGSALPLVQSGPQQMASASPPLQSMPRANEKPGFWSRMLGTDPPLAVARMTSYRYDQSGAFIVALANGQEWRQTDVVGGKATWLKKPSAYTVTITKGTFGSYGLRTDDSPRTYKVERVK